MGELALATAALNEAHDDGLAAGEAPAKEDDDTAVLEPASAGSVNKRA